MELLNTDSCRETVPMEPPMSNSSMRHQNPDVDFDDTGQILLGSFIPGPTQDRKVANLIINNPRF
jgi:hypothetical protein